MNSSISICVQTVSTCVPTGANRQRFVCGKVTKQHNGRLCWQLTLTAASFYLLLFSIIFVFPGLILDSLTPGRKGNLTGSARKLKDNAADWHNFILKWERLNDEGSATATKIVNLVLSKEPVKEMNLLAGADTDQSVTPPVGADTLKSVKDLEEECTKLQEIVEKMAHIVSKMEKIVSSEKGICDLETFQFGAKGRDCPLFLTWPTSEFVDVSTSLCKCYRQELALKQLILRELAHTSDPQLSMVYLSSWLYQPYLDDQTKLLLESLLLETGHRTL